MTRHDVGDFTVDTRGGTEQFPTYSSEHGISVDTVSLGRRLNITRSELQKKLGQYMVKIIKNLVVELNLTGNDLGMLGNVETIPSERDVDKFAKEHLQYVGIDTVKKHTFAKEFLDKNDVISAWKVLLMN